MRGLADAALLAVMAAGSFAAVPLLARASWTRRSPVAAILLWQALGLAGGMAAVGALLAPALPGGKTSILGEMWQPYTASDAVTRGPAYLVTTRIVLLVAGLALFVLLVGVLIAATATVIFARRRQRELLTLIAHGDPKVPGALVLDHPAATAYCVPGLRSSRIVISAGAVKLLEPAELAAVLAHERAHLRERHDLVLLPFTALRRAFPRSGTIADAYRAVALLVEMHADDRALRARPARELVSALVRVGTSGGAPAGALAVSSGEGEMAARVLRLLRPLPPLPAATVAGICAGAALLAAAPALLLAWLPGAVRTVAAAAALAEVLDLRLDVGQVHRRRDERRHRQDGQRHVREQREREPDDRADAKDDQPQLLGQLPGGRERAGRPADGIAERPCLDPERREAQSEEEYMQRGKSVPDERHSDTLPFLALLGLHARVLLAKRLVDLDQHLLLPLVELGIGEQRRPHAGVGRPVFENPGLDVEGFRGDAQPLGDLLQDVGTRFAQTALDLAQVRVGHPGLLGQLPERDPRLLPLLPDVLTDGCHGSILPARACKC